jgi:predicted nucleic acid-binding protein
MRMIAANMLSSSRLFVLDALAATGDGHLTAQVLGEFFRVTTKLSTRILSAERAQQEIGNFVLTWTILDTTAMVVQEAVRGVLAHQMPYYDAQVWAAARLNQIPVIFSEDFTDGRMLEGVRFVNPFSSSFALEAWSG